METNLLHSKLGYQKNDDPQIIVLNEISYEDDKGQGKISFRIDGIAAAKNQSNKPD